MRDRFNGPHSDFHLDPRAEPVMIEIRRSTVRPPEIRIADAREVARGDDGAFVGGVYGQAFPVHRLDDFCGLGRDYAKRELGMVGDEFEQSGGFLGGYARGACADGGGLGLTYPVCYDESQVVAKGYEAAAPPISSCSIKTGAWFIAGNLTTAGRNGKPVKGAELRAENRSALT